MLRPIAGAATLTIARFGATLAWRVRRNRAKAVLASDGYQEATVIINGRYRPETVEVRLGVPVRLHFLRQEDDPCSERVIFASIGVDRRLQAFKETTIEFVPREAGTFMFTCQMGMYRGRLVVKPARRPREADERRPAGAER